MQPKDNPSRKSELTEPVGYGANNSLEQFLNDPFGSWMDLSRPRRESVPNVIESETSVMLSMDVPGIPKEKIHVNVDGNLLTVSAESQEERKGTGFARSYRSFRQTLSIPSSIDADKIEAHCENGVLEILMPKLASSASKRIDVQTGRGSFLGRLGESAKNSEGAPPPKKH